MIDLSDRCLRCGTFIEQIDETDPRCFANGEEYEGHEFRIETWHKYQQRDQEKLKAWTEAALS